MQKQLELLIVMNLQEDIIKKLKKSILIQQK